MKKEFNHFKPTPNDHVLIGLTIKNIDEIHKTVACNVRNIHIFISIDQLGKVDYVILENLERLQKFKLSMSAFHRNGSHPRVIIHCSRDLARSLIEKFPDYKDIFDRYDGAEYFNIGNLIAICLPMNIRVDICR